jgi:hypothetical protein
MTWREKGCVAVDASVTDKEHASSMLVMPRRIIRVGSGLLTAIFWLWTGANLMLDYLGRALSLKDLASKQGLLAQFLTWIFSTPWWVPSLLATAITIALLLLLYRDSRAGVSGELESSSYRIVEFFPDRSSLQQFSGGSLGARLGSVETACAIMVNALDYYSRDINTHCIKKLLLPNPAGDSLKSHVATTSHPGQADVIKETTQLAKKAGAAVRWYDHFVRQIIWVGSSGIGASVLTHKQAPELHDLQKIL